MASLEEMLADAKALADDTEVEIPGFGKTKVSEIRRVLGARHKEAEEKFSVEMKKLEDQRKKVDQLGEQALALYESLEADKQKLAARPATKETKEAEYDWESDPLLSPIAKKLKAYEDASLKLNAQIENLSKALAQGFEFVVSDYNDRRWNTIPEAERPKDKTWRDFFKTAAEKKIVNEWGLPDPLLAFEKETAKQREQRIREAARTEGIEEGKRMQQMASLPRPAASVVPTSTAAKEKSFGTLDEAINAALEDPEILKITQGVQ